MNAGLWWKVGQFRHIHSNIIISVLHTRIHSNTEDYAQPNPSDWDENFPAGWQASDLVGATDRVFQRIPGTLHPSQDGDLYLRQGFDTLASGLNASGWEYVVPNDSPDKKNRTFGHTTFMYSGGERGGPLATYLTTAAARTDLFTLWTGTGVDRIIRNGSQATGVQVSCSVDGGYEGTVNLTPKTGRVILSAGAFGTPKVLFRSELFCSHRKHACVIYTVYMYGLTIIFRWYRTYGSTYYCPGLIRWPDYDWECLLDQPPSRIQSCRADECKYLHPISIEILVSVSNSEKKRPMPSLHTQT